MLSTSLIPLSRRRPAPSAAALLPALICVLFFVSGLAQTAIVPLLPALAAHYGLAESESAFVLALPGLAMLAVSVPAGILADRLGARRVTLASAVLLVAGCAMQALAGLGPLIGGRIVYGVSFGVLWTAGATWLTALGDAPSDSTGGGDRVGPAVVCASVGTMVGPALGGLLGHGAGDALPFATIAAAAVLVGSALAACPPRCARAGHAHDSRRPGAAHRHDVVVAGVPALGDAPPSHTEAGGPLRDLAGHARDVWVAAGAGSLVVAGALSGVTQLLIAQGLRSDGVSAGDTGLAFSACAVGYIAVSALFVRLGRRAHTLPINAIVTGLGAIALVPALVSSSPGVLVAALMLTAAPRGAINVVAYGLASAGSRTAGSVFGLLNGAWGAATVLVPLVAGGLAEHAGTRAGFLAAIVPGVAITLWLVVAIPRGSAGVRDRPLSRVARRLLVGGG